MCAFSLLFLLIYLQNSCGVSVKVICTSESYFLKSPAVQCSEGSHYLGLSTRGLLGLSAGGLLSLFAGGLGGC
jgi:hypothetical protein